MTLFPANEIAGLAFFWDVPLRAHLALLSHNGYWNFFPYSNLFDGPNDNIMNSDISVKNSSYLAVPLETVIWYANT